MSDASGGTEPTRYHKADTPYGWLHYHSLWESPGRSAARPVAGMWGKMRRV